MFITDWIINHCMPNYIVHVSKNMPFVSKYFHSIVGWMHGCGTHRYRGLTILCCHWVFYRCSIWLVSNVVQVYFLADFLVIIKSRVLAFPNIIVELSISLFRFISFCFLCFDALIVRCLYVYNYYISLIEVDTFTL